MSERTTPWRPSTPTAKESPLSSLERTRFYELTDSYKALAELACVRYELPVGSSGGHVYWGEGFANKLSSSIALSNGSLVSWPPFHYMVFYQFSCRFREHTQLVLSDSSSDREAAFLDILDRCTRVLAEDVRYHVKSREF